MTTFDADPIQELTDDESWTLLASVSLGRLATSVADQPEIFPVNFVVQRKTILLRTAEGTKLLTAIMNQRVAFEADDHDAEKGWSVVVKGHAHVLAGSAELAEADRGQVLPWITTAKNRYIRVTPSAVSGRRFRFGGEFDTGTDAS